MIILEFIAGIIFVLLACSAVVTIAYALTVALFVGSFKLILLVEKWLEKRRH